MRAALTEGPAPQRALLSAVADTLVAQERAAARIEAVVRELGLISDRIPPPEEVLSELLSLPEPQLLVADFLKEHGGGPGSDAAFAVIAADQLRAATAGVFGDLADENPAELGRLLMLAGGGEIAAVATAALGAVPYRGPRLCPAPRVTDVDPAGMLAVARVLDQLTRRNLRLATLLHGQAEAILAHPRTERPGGLWSPARRLARIPPARRPEFGTGDLTALVIALDTVGEVIDTASERAAGGEPSHAVQLLAGLRVPVPAGLPGRMYHQESLAQARPLAAFGVWHRLAVARWAAVSLQAVAQEEREPSAASVRSGRSPDRVTPDADGDQR